MATKVLVVDDVRSELQLLTSYLEQAGYFVMTATNGMEALEKVKLDRPDIIVTDLVMPELTGLELCRLLKKACTTKDRQMDQNWAKKQGVAAYVVKPCTQVQLVSAVQSIMAA
jgi:two-component system, chemotaxis family, response regulator PixH